MNCKSLWVPALTCGFLIQNSDFWSRITSLYGSQTWLFVLYMYDSVISTRITRLYGFQPSSVVLCLQNSDLMTTIVCVYGSQTSPVIFCMPKSVPSIKITSLYGSHPSSVVFACKTTTFGPEKQVSMCPRYHLQFCASNAVWLAPELHISIGPSPSLWFLHSKQRLLEQNYKSVWDPDLTCRFVHANLRD